ncbi:MAG: hypothetical protein DMG58_01965 [Acidobacteria bacterium]|nr:MAG: hypothetical protein DMG58_01965 [Acidobacteriota bacterium]
MFLLLLGAASGQKSEPPKTTFEEQPAYLLSNGALELTVLPRGSTFASVVLSDDPEKLSPLWNPLRMAREVGEKNTFDSALGHFICVDGFGPVSPEEEAAGLPGHGEAHQTAFAVKFYAKEAGATTLTLETRLPLTQERFARTVRMVDGEDVIYVQSELESLLAFDRPVFWAEHATIGSPFLEPGVTVVDMSARRAQTRPYQPEKGGLPHRLPSGKDFTWPEAPGLHTRKIDVRAAPAEPNSGDHTTCLMDASRKLVFVTALHPSKRLLIGYLFKPQEYPWTQNWEYYPPTKKLARGLEFSTQPYDVPRREVVQLNSMFGSPVYRWLPAKTKIESRFLMFYAHTPEGFGKVDDVRFESGKIIIEDHKAHKQVTLTASLPI